MTMLSKILVATGPKTTAPDTTELNATELDGIESDAVGLDETSSSLFQSALELAQATGASLQLISVLTAEGEAAMPLFSYPGMTGYPPSFDGSVWQDYQKRYQAYAIRDINRLRYLCQKAAAAGVSAEFTQASDSPGKVICDLAKSEKVDLIMVGSRGRKGLSEMLLGSVSNYVTHNAPCSVMVVHPQKASKPAKVAVSAVENSLIHQHAVSD